MKPALTVFILTVVTLIPTGPAEAESVDLLIVAGQSNAVGFDAKPGELPVDKVDNEILFWWKCGDPPPDEHDTNSGSMWARLRPQPRGNPKDTRRGRQYGNFAQAEGGFGPEMGFARTVYHREKKRLAVIKVAFSGTGIHRDWNHADPGDGGACYRALVNEIEAAITTAQEESVTLKPRAIAWVQGESDANANDAEKYADRLAAMLAALRKDIRAPKLRALVAVNTKFGNGDNRFMPTIVKQQKLAASRDPLCVYVDTSSATIANRYHFDAKGTLKVGQLFATELLKLEAKSPTK